jgi:CBS domain-containing protein
MRIEGLYRPDVVTADAGESLTAVAQRMQEYEIGSLAILEDGRIVGIVTERDLVRALAERAAPDTPVAWFANPAPRCVEPEEDAVVVARRMLELGVRHLPVVGDGRVLGMLSMRDLLVPQAWIPENQQAS